MDLVSDPIELTANESNAVFVAVRHVDILKIPGLEFHHLFLIILMKKPSDLGFEFSDRRHLFYDGRTRNSIEEDVVYFEQSKDFSKDVTWETTISASSECGYDPEAKKLGCLIKVPNFDRLTNASIGKRIFSKKIAVNDLKIVKHILDFEKAYNNSLTYSLIPEVSSGYNSNSYFRGILEYIGLADKITVPSCFKAPGLSKAVVSSH